MYYKSFFLSSFIIYFLGIVGLTSFASESNFFGENLLPDFEKQVESVALWKPLVLGKGTSSLDKKEKYADKVPYKLTALKSGTSVFLYGPMIPVNAKEKYFASLVYKNTGFGSKGYSAVASSMNILWYDAKKKNISRNPALTARLNTLGFPYIDVDWTVRDLFVIAPAGAAFVQLRVDLSNQSASSKQGERPASLWVNSPQLRLYTPPKTPEWALGKTNLIVDGGLNNDSMISYFFSDSSMHGGGKGSKKVLDKDAEKGTALKITKEKNQNLISQGPYDTSWDLGLYRARLRFKLLPGSNKGLLGILDITTGNYGTRLVMPIMTKDIPKKKQYFIIEKDFIVRGTGYNSVRIFAQANTKWQLDWCKIVPLQRLNDKLLQEIYPAITGNVATELDVRKKKPLKILVFAGIGYEKWGISDTIRLSGLDTTFDMVWIKKARKWFILNLPKSNKELFDHNIIFMVNINLDQIPINLKNTLAEYVKRGGILLVYGGFQSFERGGWKNSILEDLLPATLETSIKNGIVISEEGFELSVNSDIDLELDFSSKPKAYILHCVKAKPEAEVILKAGKYPFLVSGKYESGYVICAFAWASGKLKDKNQLPFWEWDSWKYILTSTIWKAMGIK